MRRWIYAGDPNRHQVVIDDVVFLPTAPAPEDAPMAGQLPIPLRRELRRTEAINDPRHEPFAIVPFMPYTNMPYVVRAGGLTEHTIRTFRLQRLSGIRQLGYLHDPVIPAPAGDLMYGTDFTHTRYSHVLDVGALALLMGTNNRLASAALHTLRVAALTHDALTPAGGDTIKLIDPAAFDEDAHYGELLRNYEWSELRIRYAIDPEVLIATVQGRGALGKILDIADKISYVARDAYVYVTRYAPDGPTVYPEGYADIQRLILEYPDICTLWDSVRIIDDVPVFMDADRLARFLELRVLLFRNLYYHHGARFREFLLAAVVARHLYETGTITRADLLRMTDEELNHAIDACVGIPHATMHTGALGIPRVEKFPTPTAALQRERELLDGGTALVLMEDLTGRIKPATHLLIRRGRRAPQPFREAYPEKSAHLNQLSLLEHPVRVYYIEHEPLPGSVLAALRTLRIRQAKTAAAT